MEILNDHRRQRPPDRPPPARRCGQPCAPSTRASADALEAVLSNNTQRVYHTQWKLFDEWCGQVGLRSLPADPLTVGRYLAAVGVVVDLVFKLLRNAYNGMYIAP